MASDQGLHCLHSLVVFLKDYVNHIDEIPKIEFSLLIMYMLMSDNFEHFIQNVFT